MQVSNEDRAGDRVRIGKQVVICDDDNVGAKHLIAHPISYEALARQPNLGNVLSIGSDLGRAIYNARVGERRVYERDGVTESVWIVLIEDPDPVWPRPAEAPIRVRRSRCPSGVRQLATPLPAPL